VPDSDRVGEVDQGWTVGTRWMFHEKNAMGGGSPYVTGTMEPRRATDSRDPLVELADATGHLDEPRTLELIGEATMLRSARTALSNRITAGMSKGVFPENSAAIARLITAVVHQRNNTIALELAGPNAAATLPDDPWAEEGFNFLERQTSGIGGGTTEMARNNISERVLGMPRELTADKNIPFRDVPKGPSGN
jgi:hypothetical protein